MANGAALSKQERLAELVAPSSSALLIQEMQRGVVGADSGLPALAAVVAEVGLIDRVAQVAGTARRAGVKIVHCTAENLPADFGINRNARLFRMAQKAGMDNRPGSAEVRPVAELGPEPDDLVLPRYHGLSPMSGSPLDQLLRNSGVSTVVVVGVSLNIAIPNLVFDAVNRSYQVVVVADAVAGTPVEYASEMITNTLSLVATMTTAAELEHAWARS